MSDLLSQVQNAATQAANATANLASQAAHAINEAANSPAAQNLTAQAKNLGAQAATGATQLANQAHAQAHAALPNLVPAPAAGIDTRDDLSPSNEMDREKMERLFASRASAQELQDKNILKGAPGDALAGKRAELEKSMLENKLDKDIAQRPTADELVKKGILNRGFSLLG